MTDTPSIIELNEPGNGNFAAFCTGQEMPDKRVGKFSDSRYCKGQIFQILGLKDHFKDSLSLRQGFFLRKDAEDNAGIPGLSGNLGKSTNGEIQKFFQGLAIRISEYGRSEI